jgi:predicted dehydrogenase
MHVYDRRFAAGAFWWKTPRSTMGSEERRMLRVGLMGAGMVSRHHLIAWQHCADAEVVAIADPAPERAQARAAEFGIPRVFTDAAALLDAGGIDAVDIAAPRAAHVGLVRLAAGHGLAVLCQKPLAPSLAEAEALVAEMRGRIRLMVHENWRHRAYYRQAAAWLAAGMIGTPRLLNLRVLTSGLLADATGHRPALERQPFMQTEQRMLVAEVLIHHLDTLRMLLGGLRVTSAALVRSVSDMAGEDGAAIQLAADNGVAVSVFASMAAYGAPSGTVDDMDLLGSAGRIRLSAGVLTCEGSHPARIAYDLGETYQAAYDAVIAHFVDALRHDRPFETDAEENLGTLRLVEDIYRLAGGPVPATA